MFVASLIIVVAVMLLLCYLIGDQQEGFWGWRRHGPRYCPNCGYNTLKSCLRCVNCGYGLAQTGRASCIPGDERGPYFASDIINWNYGGGNRSRRHSYRYNWWNFL